MPGHNPHPRLRLNSVTLALKLCTFQSWFNAQHVVVRSPLMQKEEITARQNTLRYKYMYSFWCFLDNEDASLVFANSFKILRKCIRRKQPLQPQLYSTFTELLMLHSPQADLTIYKCIHIIKKELKACLKEKKAFVVILCTCRPNNPLCHLRCKSLSKRKRDC